MSHYKSKVNNAILYYIKLKSKIVIQFSPHFGVPDHRVTQSNVWKVRHS